MKPCDQSGCGLGPLGPEECRPRYYRMKDDPHGPVLVQYKHDNCHERFLSEKTGFEPVTDLSGLPRMPAAPLGPEKSALRSSPSSPDGRGVVVNADGRTASYQKGRARFIGPKSEMGRMQKMWMKEKGERPVALGISARAKLLQERNAGKRK
jgi:hypothetical protein